MKPQPWHRVLIDRVFAGGPAVPLAKHAAVVGQSVKACQRVLDSAWGQEELGRYHAARRAILAAKGVQPLEELAEYGHQAVRGLVRAQAMAEEQENPRELREASVAILRFLGYEPAKRVEKTIRTEVDRIRDPLVLAKIISGEIEDVAALPAPEETH